MVGCLLAHPEGEDHFVSTISGRQLTPSIQSYPRGGGRGKGSARLGLGMTTIKQIIQAKYLHIVS